METETPFYFRGRLPSSKSMMNRALILRSHQESLLIRGETDAEDVVFLRKALGKIEDGKEFYCGEGGTTLRFFTLRASREVGQFTIKGSESLFRRPQGALLEIASQLGVQIRPAQNALVVKSEGWKKPAQPVRVPTADSSQFASALVLNSWNLPFDLELEFEGPLVSESYFHMTLEMCRRAGLQFELQGRGMKIPAGQKITAETLEMEPDWSSLFSVAALAALGGEAEFHQVQPESLQPDRACLEILKSMNVPVDFQDQLLRIRQSTRLRAGVFDLSLCPDLAPVLGVLCAFAEGRSELKGAAHLRHKESDRIRTTVSLLKKAGVEAGELSDGLWVQGQPQLSAGAPLTFDCEKDHRLAMAAGLLILKGFAIRMQGADCVEKSFPEYWSLLRTGPHLIVGQRGTGKTGFFKRHHLPGWDLDEEIEKRSGQTAFELFKNRGEDVFRQWELSTLKELLKQAGPRDWIVLGAGLRLDQADRRGEVVWIRRDTDKDGRVFLDRPRLDPGIDPLVEYRQRAKPREQLFEKYADRVITLPEGLIEEDAFEKKIAFETLHEIGGVVTLSARHRKTLPQLGADLYELRNDILENDELQSLFYKIPERQILYSVRRPGLLPEFVKQSQVLIDWGLEAGYPEKDLIQELGPRLILSSHGTLKESLLDFKLFAKTQAHLKMSPLVESFEDLKAGHLWWSQDPTRRSFLPRSSDGRWAWYRLWMKGRLRLNFWREGSGSAPDQPTLWQWLRTPVKSEKFAAVLGSPVHHSWTPVEQAPFFSRLGVPVWAIEIREGEWDKAFPFLQELGLSFAAVTAPLKGRAFRSCEPTPLAKELKSVNTLAWDSRRQLWVGHNTDFEGLQEAAKNLVSGPIAIWGGGGTLQVLGHVLPGSSAFSARTGKLREGSPELKKFPRVVVWAAPWSGDLTWPPEAWKPDLVFDLNYKEDSPGRDYALRCGARYVSGDNMFRAQAAGQRQFWSAFLKG